MPSKPLERGELEAIALAKELKADALLIDDRYGREEAVRQELPIVGTLAELAKAADAELIDLPNVVARLRQTNFRVQAKSSSNGCCRGVSAPPQDGDLAARGCVNSDMTVRGITTRP